MICRNPDNSLEKSEEAEFAQGPLSILYKAVKNNTSVGARAAALMFLGTD